MGGGMGGNGGGMNMGGGGMNMGGGGMNMGGGGVMNMGGGGMNMGGGGSNMGGGGGGGSIAGLPAGITPQVLAQFSIDPDNITNQVFVANVSRKYTELYMITDCIYDHKYPLLILMFYVFTNRVSIILSLLQLDYKVTSRKLREIFKMAGNVQSTEIKEDKDGNSRGFGTVKFEHPMEAIQAISMFHNQVLFERVMTVKMDKHGDTMLTAQQVPNRLPSK